MIDDHAPAPADGSDPQTEARRGLVANLAGRGIVDARVLSAMGAVARHHYVESSQRPLAYADRPLSIGLGQTISQPYIVALMAQLAEIGPDDRVLEVGTGSGYGAAILGSLAARVVTIERHERLAAVASSRLRRDGFTNVEVVIGDGTSGWEPEQPYDAIIAAASARTVPRPLLDQLGDGGRLVIPVGRRRRLQTLHRIRRRGDRFADERLGPVRFVPLVGS